MATAAGDRPSSKARVGAGNSPRTSGPLPGSDPLLVDQHGSYPEELNYLREGILIVLALVQVFQVQAGDIGEVAEDLASLLERSGSPTPASPRA